MSYTTILKKGKGVLLFIYYSITNKFTNMLGKLKERFPVLNRYPLLKYCLIPVLIAMFLLLRYLIKYMINELATWTSGFVGETSGYTVSESTIFLGIVAVFIMFRIVLKLRNQKKKKTNELELNYESAK